MVRICLKTTNKEWGDYILDLYKIFSACNIDILFIELAGKEISLEIGSMNSENFSELQSQLLKVPQINQVFQIRHMPHEEREQQLKIVMESISEGILAIDSFERIFYLNHSAERILDRDISKILGKSLHEINFDDTLLASLHNGITYDNHKLMISTSKGLFHYLCSGRPIKDADGKNIGAVAVLKGIKDVDGISRPVEKHFFNSLDDIINVSNSMQRAIEIAKIAANTESPVLLRGDRGTEKEMLAYLIHKASSRSRGIFAQINCAALPEALLERQLFGYEEDSEEKKETKQGLFESAQGGTIFLNEVGGLSQGFQVKLQMVLQERVVKRIGSNREKSIKCSDYCVNKS